MNDNLRPMKRSTYYKHLAYPDAATISYPPPASPTQQNNLSSKHEPQTSPCFKAQPFASVISMFALARNASEFLRFRKYLARFESKLMRTGIEFVLVGPNFLNKLILFTMFSGAGLFTLGGRYGFPECERLCSGIGSRKEQVTRRRGTCGLANDS